MKILIKKQKVKILKVTMFFYFILILQIFTPYQAFSQRSCGSHEYYILSNENPQIRKEREELESRIRQFIRQNISYRSEEQYRIPVVVHVVMPNPNDVSDAQIFSQIDVLNEDYNALNVDLPSVPNEFHGLISNTMFEFYLASVGPDCNGITRTVSNVPCFTYTSNDIKRNSTGGRDPIDTEHILNIWVGNLCGPILGYGTFPGEPLLTDGVAIDFTAFGRIGILDPDYNLGRTATHEVGHYFNLFHIWGDDQDADPDEDCDGTDNVDDTPNQNQANFGCPTFPHISCNNGPNGDLFYDFMDYCDDDCLLMFTNGQSDRMIASLLNGRHGLIEGYVSDISVELHNTDPICGIPNGSLIANVRCGEPPYEYLWSNNETTQTIENLSAGTYSVTVTDAVGNTAEATISLEEEIIIPGEQPLWSQAIEHYHLSPTDLYQRNVFIEKELIMDVDYSFWGVNLGFANESQFTIAEGITTNTNSYYSNQTIFKPCEGEWKGISLNSNSKLNLLNSEILNATKGISALSNSELNLNNCSIVGEIGNIGIEMEGDVRCKVEYTTIDNYLTAVQSNANSTLPEFAFCTFTNVNVGFNCLQSPISVGFSTISPSEISVTLDQCPGSILAFCQFNSGQRGISAINSPAVTLGFIYGENQLKDWITLDRCSYSNVLYGVNLKASEYGLKAFNSFGLEISDLNFEINGIPNTAGGGIQLNDCYDGKILHNKIDANQCTYGIETNNSSGNEISNNTIDLFSSISIRTAAIRNLGSTFEKVDNNLINGLANVTGIFAQNSSANTYSCNEMTNTDDGLSIYYNSILQDIKGNKFYDCNTDLSIRSVIGKQYYKGNEFYNGTAKAIDLNPYQIENSQFYVNSSILHHMPCCPIPGNNRWFKDDPMTFDYFLCRSGDRENEGTGLDWQRLVFENDISHSRQFINLMHILSYDYFRNDYTLPDSLRNNAIWNNYTGIFSLSDEISKFRDISKIANMELMGDVYHIRSLQKTLLSTEDQQTKENILNNLRELISNNNVSFNAELLNDDAIYTLLSNQLADISEDTLIDKWGELYRMYVNFLMKGKVAYNERERVLEYSRKCSDNFGDPIHLARIMANTFDPTYFDIYDDCPEQIIEPRIKSGDELIAIVQPNPSDGNFNIHFDNSMTGTIKVLDLSGEVIFEKRMRNIFDFVLNMEVYSGTYILNVTTDDGKILNDKLVIIK